MRKLGVLVVVVALLLSAWPTSIRASTDERFERIKYLQNKVDEFSVLGVYSDSEVYSVWVDLNNVSNNGSVSAYTYKDGVTNPSAYSFSTTPRSFNYAVDKLTRFVLGNVANVYRQPPYNTEITMITHQRTTIPIYVYGSYKNEAVDEIVYGLPNCFDIEYDTSEGYSRPVTPLPMPVMEKILGQFMLEKAVYTANGETKVMDVTPEIKDNRAFFPVRFIAYTLDVEDKSITWDAQTYTVTLMKGETTVKMTIGSNKLIVNETETVMDVAPYIKDGRTMLPARYLAEAFGATVEWSEETKMLTIKVVEQGQ